MKHDMKTIREALGLVRGSAEFSVRANSEVTEYAQTLSKTLADAIDELEALRAEVAKLKASEAEAVERAQEMEMRAATTHENARAEKAGSDDFMARLVECLKPVGYIDGKPVLPFVAMLVKQAGATDACMEELYLEDRITIIARMLNEQSRHAFEFEPADPRNEFIRRMLSVLHGRAEEVPTEYSFLIGKRKVRK